MTPIKDPNLELVIVIFIVPFVVNVSIKQTCSRSLNGGMLFLDTCTFNITHCRRAIHIACAISGCHDHLMLCCDWSVTI